MTQRTASDERAASTRRRPSAAKKYQARQLAKSDPAEIAASLSNTLIAQLGRALRGDPMLKNTPRRLEELGLTENVRGKWSRLTALGLNVYRASRAIERLDHHKEQDNG